jgi:hypothetical protein
MIFHNKNPRMYVECMYTESVEIVFLLLEWKNKPKRPGCDIESNKKVDAHSTVRLN